MEELSKCRLCNYQSDKRLMLNIFDESTDYSNKIKNYLNIKISSQMDHFICFHCSQTIDNFHNFATKIQQIQKIIFPEEPEELINLEDATIIEILPSYDPPKQTFSPSTSVLNISKNILNILESPKNNLRRSQRSQKSEKVFEELRKDVHLAPLDLTADESMSELQSHRSFDLDEQFCGSDDEIEEFEDLTGLRDPDDEDFPSAEALKKIPTTLLSEEGSLLYKGKQLMKFLSIFYNTKCKICDDKKFRSITSLFQHHSEFHPESPPHVTCCSMKLEKIPKIIWHFAQHIEPEAFKCGICGYAVSRPKFLEIHQQTHRPESEKPLECDKCDKRFIWKGALKSHLMQHHSQPPAFICNICDRKYKTSGSLSSHKRSAHRNIPKTRKLCEICSKSFSTLTSYKEHLTLHSDDQYKMQLKCSICDKWLKNKRCLQSHILLHTSEEQKCNLCDYVTRKEKLMKNHMMTKHNDDKLFKCSHPKCDKSFKVKRALTIHLQQHEGKSSARKCEFCGRDFANSTNYYTHRKNLHAKELQMANEKKIEEEKLKRIRAGLEVFGDRVEVIQEGNFDVRDEAIVITLNRDEF